MDEADYAAENEQLRLRNALQDMQKNTGPKFEPKGSCYNCETEFEATDPLKDKKLYCDSECEQDHREFLRRGGR